MTSHCSIFIPNEAEMSMKETVEVVQKDFDETFRLLHDWAAKNNITLEELKNSISEEEIKRREKNRRNARTNETSKLAFDYRQNVSDFLRKYKTEFDAQQEILIKEADLGMQSTVLKAKEIGYAMETICWYMSQLPAKLTRAYVGLVEFGETTEDPIQSDFNGSAKVALIGIENSFPAWEVILAYFPQTEKECWSFLVLLDKIRKRILVDFPNVREFVRPGFDAVKC